MKHLSQVLLLIVALASSLQATGSMGTDEIMPLLKQNPELFRLITESLELSPGASGSRIGQSVNSRLGGTRVAPYYLRAKPKGAADWTYDVRIDADVVYLDDNGKIVDLLEAHSFREKLTGITIGIRK